MEEKLNYSTGDVLVYDNINDIPKNELGVIDLEMVLAFVCYEGGVQFCMMDKVYEVEQSQGFVCLPYMAMSRILMTPNARVRVFGIAPKALDNIIYINQNVLENTFDISSHPVFSLDETELQMIDHLCAIVGLQAQMSQRTHYHQMVRSLMQSMFYALVDTIIKSSKRVGDEVLSHKDQLFRHFLMLLANSDGRIRSVTEFAKQMCISPKYLSTLVRTVSGQTPMDWIQKCTVSVIIQRLRYSDMSIKEISNELGFPNPSFFGRFCKQHLGYSPREYRKRIQEGNMESK